MFAFSDRRRKAAASIPRNESAHIIYLMLFLFVILVPKYLNFPTFSNDVLAISISWFVLHSTDHI
jgi:hypothetical protein